MRAACDAAGVALVPLVAPTTPDERMARIGASARGFVYAVSVAGTTGERAALADGLRRASWRAPRPRPTVPVALGFGIGTPEQAREAADAGADGVIVGSRLVRAAAEAEDPRGRGPRAGGALRAGPEVESRRHMGLVVVTTVGLVVWLVMWALGVKALDSFMITVSAGAPGRDGAHHRPVPAGQSRQPDGTASTTGSVARRLRASIDSRVLIGIAFLEEGNLRARSLAASGCLVTALALGVAACGGGNDNSSTSSGGGGGGRTSLTIYSSLPLQGDSRPQSTDVVNGEKLALEEAGGKVGKFTIKYVSLDDATAAAGKWDPGQTSADARKAAQDAVHHRLPRRVQLGGVGDLDPDPQRGEHPADLAVEHLRRPDPLRGRRQGRAGQVLPVRQAHLRARRPRRPHPGRGPGDLPEGSGLQEDLHPE